MVIFWGHQLGLTPAFEGCRREEGGLHPLGGAGERGGKREEKVGEEK